MAQFWWDLVYSVFTLVEQTHFPSNWNKEKNIIKDRDLDWENSPKFRHAKTIEVSDLTFE